MILEVCYFNLPILFMLVFIHSFYYDNSHLTVKSLKPHIMVNTPNSFPRSGVKNYGMLATRSCKITHIFPPYVCPYVWPPVRTRESLNKFSQNCMLGNSTEMRRSIPVLIESDFNIGLLTWRYTRFVWIRCRGGEKRIKKVKNILSVLCGHCKRWK